jgi:hypothetical protein
LDVIGLGLLAPALTGILLGLSNLSEDGGIDHTGVLVPLLAGIALLGAFIRWAARPGGWHPVRLLRWRSLGTASEVLFAAGAAIYAGMFLLPLYYQQLHGESVLHAALLLIPQGVGSLVARFVVGKLVAPPRRPSGHDRQLPGNSRHDRAVRGRRTTYRPGRSASCS